MGDVIAFPGRFGPLTLVGEDVSAVIVRHGPITMLEVDRVWAELTQADALSALNGNEEVELP